MSSTESAKPAAVFFEGVQPILRVRDLAASLDYYVRHARVRDQLAVSIFCVGLARQMRSFSELWGSGKFRDVGLDRRRRRGCSIGRVPPERS